MHSSEFLQIVSGTLFGHMPIPYVWLEKYEQVTCAVAFVLVIKPLFLAGTSRHYLPRFLACLVLLIQLSQRNEPFSEAQALKWGIRIAEVICLIHDHDHIYGFIAPDHLMRSPENGIFLIDFGKVASYSPGKEFPAIGQAGYSPPEQYVGKTEPCSDVFSLGVFLYHLTTLRDPRQPHAAFLFHVVPPTAVNPELSLAFESVILRAVEHKATDRFQSMFEMQNALDMIVVHVVSPFNQGDD